MIELALQPDFVDHWLIRVGVRVDDVWHNSLLPLLPISKEEDGAAMVLPRRHESVVRSVVLRRLRQTELAGAGDGFGPPLDLELAEDPTVMAFHRVQGEEQSCP